MKSVETTPVAAVTEKTVNANLEHIIGVIEHHLLQAHLQLTLEDAKIVRKLFTGKHVNEMASKIAFSIAG